MDIKIVDEGGAEKKQNAEKTPEQLDAPVFPELEQRAVEQVLGIENDVDRGHFKKEIDTILKFAKANTKGSSMEDLKWAIRNLEIRLGTPPFGEDRVRYLSRYAYLAMERNKIDGELKSFELV